MSHLETEFSYEASLSDRNALQKVAIDFRAHMSVQPFFGPDSSDNGAIVALRVSSFYSGLRELVVITDEAHRRGHLTASAEIKLPVYHFEGRSWSLESIGEEHREDVREFKDLYKRRGWVCPELMWMKDYRYAQKCTHVLEEVEGA